MAPCATTTTTITTSSTLVTTTTNHSHHKQPHRVEPPIITITSLEEHASREIQRLLERNNNNIKLHHRHHRHYHYGTTAATSFPPHCLRLVRQLSGNHRCIDCHAHNPQWAAVRYGALLCLQCSGIHRSLGVQISSVRSIDMDEWSAKEVLSMLEGGNRQLNLFFQRHCLTEDSITRCQGDSGSGGHHTHNHNHYTTTNNNNNHHNTNEGIVLSRDNVHLLRYKTKAALFYRRQMEQHVQTIISAGPYLGRERSRLPQPPRSSTTTTTIQPPHKDENNENE